MKIEFFAEGGTKLSEEISRQVSGVPLNKIKLLIKNGEVRLDNSRVMSDIVPICGQNVSVFVPQKFRIGEGAAYFFTDQNIAVVIKPPLMDTENNLTAFVQSEYPYARPVHRLDRNTKGLVVFALNDGAYNALITAFKNRTVDKYYLALVSGRVKKADELKAYLVKDAAKSLVYISDTPQKGGKEIITHYKLVTQHDDCALIEVQLVTGRTHQIRAHLAHIGHPIIGDGKYGDSKTVARPPQSVARLNDGLQLVCNKIIFRDLPGGLNYLNGKIFFLMQ